MKSSFRLSLDKLGMCTSAFCAIHCLITPFILLTFPLTGLAFLEWEGFELGILALGLFLAVTSLVFSFLRKHRNIRPLILAIIGFTFFVVGKLFHVEIIEIIFSVLGGLLVFKAHYINYQLTKSIIME